MKADEKENSQFSGALDVMIELFNNLEEDEPLISYTEENAGLIEKAKAQYGGEAIDKKINNIISEMLSFLPLDTKKSGKETEDNEKKT